ncbi:hypothetical protein CYMTET_21605 [Cymbomonas tetramitiformis]|uniref:Uncharacterized protein n=1 Tax=Cymbomonas tetramitiformis TaxID=36881 RepID=A0AAE0L2Q6_9CHLO|nr:hypothetical protein CYMTET_21605 [Cymbomonas tetramitiformis]
MCMQNHPQDTRVLKSVVVPLLPGVGGFVLRQALENPDECHEDYAFVCTGVEQHPNGTMKVALAPGQTCGGNTNANGLSRKSKGQEKVHHFKWHAGVINSIQDRLRYYKGDSEEKPRYGWFKDSQDLFEGIVQRGRLDVKKMGCTT